MTKCYALLVLLVNILVTLTLYDLTIYLFTYQINMGHHVSVSSNDASISTCCIYTSICVHTIRFQNFITFENIF